MITENINNLFQQWCAEYIKSNIGSVEEETFFSDIVNYYGAVSVVKPEYLVSQYVVEFITEVKRRNNPSHLKRLEGVVNALTDKPLCGSIYCDDNNEYVPSIDKMTYPIYQTDNNNANSHINPYEEFVHYCIDKYFSKYADVQINCNEYANLSTTERIVTISRYFDDTINIKVSEGSNLKRNEFDLEIYKKENDEQTHMCNLSYRTSYFIVSDSPKEDRKTIYIDFSMNDCFGYMFTDLEGVKENDNAPGGSDFVINEIPGTKNEIAMALCLINGLLEFGEFKKRHKKNSITMNGIYSYVEGKRNNIDGELKVVFCYDKAYLVHVKRGSLKLKDVHSKSISYNNYVNEIDEFIKTL